jgi:hypothetical protein
MLTSCHVRASPTIVLRSRSPSSTPPPRRRLRPPIHPRVPLPQAQIPPRYPNPSPRQDPRPQHHSVTRLYPSSSTAAEPYASTNTCLNSLGGPRRTTSKRRCGQKEGQLPRLHTRLVLQSLLSPWFTMTMTTRICSAGRMVGTAG